MIRLEDEPLWRGATTLEAFVTGVLWGILKRAESANVFAVDCAAGVPSQLVVRLKSGTEVLVTVTETRPAPATPEQEQR